MIIVAQAVAYLALAFELYVISVAAAAVSGTLVGRMQSKRQIALAALSDELATIAALRARKRFLDSTTWWDLAPWRIFRYYCVLEEIACMYDEARRMGAFWSPPRGDG